MSFYSQYGQNEPTNYGSGYGNNYGGSSYSGGGYGGNAVGYNRNYMNRRNMPTSSYRRSPYNQEGNMSSYYDEYNNNSPQYYEDRIYDDEAREYERPTYRRSKTIANPDFGNFHFKKGYTAEVWLNDGETVVLSSDSRKKSYRTHYSPEYMRSFFFGWIGRLLRFFYLDRLFGLHVDTVKNVTIKNFIFVTAHSLPI